LGAGWRLPTFTEWSNVDNVNGWVNWNGPWNSALKIHAAGFLDTGDGLLYLRGSTGYYWSSTQWSTFIGWDMSFDSGSSGLSYYQKTYGYTLRCLKE